jgi:hypothetical protein
MPEVLQRADAFIAVRRIETERRPVISEGAAAREVAALR